VRAVEMVREVQHKEKVVFGLKTGMGGTQEKGVRVQLSRGKKGEKNGIERSSDLLYL